MLSYSCMATAHIKANKEDIAPVVLFFGDPIRSRNAAMKYLHDYKIINNVRCAFGYTGYTKNNKRITIMTHGMGQPSLGIYAYELIKFYDVKVIVRAGTCGGYQPELNLLDLVIASEVITDSNWPKLHGLDNDTVLTADEDIIDIAKKAADEIGVIHHEGRIITSDVFYDQDPNEWKKYQKQGVLSVEMETFALYQLAREHGVKALSIVSVSDSFVHHQEMTHEQRSQLTKMVQIGIAILEKYA